MVRLKPFEVEFKNKLLKSMTNNTLASPTNLNVGRCENYDTGWVTKIRSYCFFRLAARTSHLYYHYLLLLRFSMFSLLTSTTLFCLYLFSINYQLFALIVIDAERARSRNHLSTVMYSNSNHTTYRKLLIFKIWGMEQNDYFRPYN